MIRRDDADSSNRMSSWWPHTPTGTLLATHQPLPALPLGVPLFQTHPPSSRRHITILLWLTCASTLSWRRKKWWRHAEFVGGIGLSARREMINLLQPRSRLLQGHASLAPKRAGAWQKKCRN